MLGAFKARLAPFNVNYRYVAEELRYLFDDAGAKAIVYQSAFASTLAEVLPQLPALTVLIQVADESEADLLPGAVWYEDVLAGASSAVPPTYPDPDDLYILYTGGTTGMPKGVLWRQADIFVEALGGRRTDQSAIETYEELAIQATSPEGGLRAGARAAVHARRRALDELSHLAPRGHRVHPEPSRAARSRGHLVADRAREGRVSLDRGRRVRAATARRARSRHLRPLVAHRVAVGRRASVGSAEAGVPRAPPGAHRRRRTRILRGGRPDAARLRRWRGLDGHVHALGRQPRAFGGPHP